MGAVVLEKLIFNARVNVNVNGLTDGRTDGRNDGRKTGRLYRTLLKQVRQKWFCLHEHKRDQRYPYGALLLF